MSNIHELKILPQFFKPVEEGTKTFEIRRHDREFEVGDILILKEWDNGLYPFSAAGCHGGLTGQEIIKEVSYILEGGRYGLEEGYCILGLKPIGIELKNIDLTGLTLVDELVKAEEEEKEFKQALLGYLYDKHEISREHLLEELCDTIQVKLSVMKTIDIDIEMIADYWNTEHLEKIKNRPRKEDKYE